MDVVLAVEVLAVEAGAAIITATERNL
ncbi:hypothetical protein FHS83_000546 [Rhizomicrobium palustre]|uniref:Uncharacterized protein n=1 Tax=Rhizomicrobium palustre TaxID=189966 RepID=A0A846MUP2_9PROT|nr:hypothetical protein [Rhizomicrobium palustre]